MSTLVQIHRTNENDAVYGFEYQNRKVSNSEIVQSIIFDTEEQADSFIEEFGNKYDTYSRSYVAKKVPTVENIEFEMVFSLYISDGQYQMDSELQAVNTTELGRMIRENYNDAFRLNSSGEIIKLEGYNVGKHTWYTSNSTLNEYLARLEEGNE